MSESPVATGLEERLQSVRESAEPPAMPTEVSERIFRLQGVTEESLTPDFMEQRSLLGLIYDASTQLIRVLYEKGVTDNPTVGELRETLKTARRSPTEQARLNDPTELGKLLILLAGQMRPLLHVVPELTFGVDGFGVVQRVVLPMRLREEPLRRAYRQAVDRSVIAVREAISSGELKTDWEVVERALERGTSLEDIEFLGERLDGSLRTLFIRPPANDANLAGHAQVVNEVRRKFLFGPLVQSLRQSDMVTVVDCSDLRGASGAFRRSRDLIYVNQPDLLAERLNRLCDLLSSDLFGAWVKSDERRDLRARRSNLPDFIMQSRKLAGRLIEFLEAKALDGMPPRHMDILVEVSRLGELVHNFEQQAKVREEFEELREIVERIRKHGSLLEIKSGDRLLFSEKYTTMLLEGRVSQVLAGTTPAIPYEPGMELALFESIYAIVRHPGATGVAIERALELFQQSGDDSLLFVLEHVLRIDQEPEAELKSYIPPVLLYRLREALQKAYARSLPPLRRFWLSLTSRELSPDQLRNLKRTRRAAEKERFRARRSAGVERERQRVEKRQKAGGKQRIADELKSEKSAFAEVRRRIQRSWQKGGLPDRNDIREHVSSGAAYYVDRIFKGIAANDQRYQAVISIPVPEEEPIFAEKAYLLKHRERLLADLQKKLAGVTRQVADPAIKGRAGDEARRLYRTYGALIEEIERLGS